MDSYFTFAQNMWNYIVTQCISVGFRYVERKIENLYMPQNTEKDKIE